MIYLVEFVLEMGRQWYGRGGALGCSGWSPRSPVVDAGSWSLLFSLAPLLLPFAISLFVAWWAKDGSGLLVWWWLACLSCDGLVVLFGFVK